MRRAARNARWEELPIPGPNPDMGGSEHARAAQFHRGVVGAVRAGLIAGFRRIVAYPRHYLAKADPDARALAALRRGPSEMRVERLDDTSADDARYLIALLREVAGTLEALEWNRTLVESNPGPDASPLASAIRFPGTFRYPECPRLARLACAPGRCALAISLVRMAPNLVELSFPRVAHVFGQPAPAWVRDEFRDALRASRIRRLSLSFSDEGVAPKDLPPTLEALLTQRPLFHRTSPVNCAALAGLARLCALQLDLTAEYAAGTIAALARLGALARLDLRVRDEDGGAMERAARDLAAAARARAIDLRVFVDDGGGGAGFRAALRRLARPAAEAGHAATIAAAVEPGEATACIDAVAEAGPAVRSLTAILERRVALPEVGDAAAALLACAPRFAGPGGARVATVLSGDPGTEWTAALATRLLRGTGAERRFLVVGCRSEAARAYLALPLGTGDGRPHPFDSMLRGIDGVA